MIFIRMAAAAAMLAAASALPAAERVEGRPAPASLPAPPEGQGQVLFWRSGTMVGSGMGCGVNLGTERISALGAGHYFLMALPPGTHEFNAKSEAKDRLSVDVKAGETSYVKCTIKMGLMVGRPNLSPSTPEEFEKKRGDLKYVDSDDLGAKALPDPAPAAAQAR